MGLQAEMGFTLKPANAAQRVMQRIAATPAGSWVFQRTLFRVDRPLHRWTDGRVTMPGLLSGLPVLMLTTIGAKSGQQRTMPLAAIPYGDDFAVIGTNYAQGKTPGWVFNLEKNPAATIAWRDRTHAVVAQPIPAADMDSLWQAAAAVYPGFAQYRQRIGDSRAVRGFVLTPSPRPSV